MEKKGGGTDGPVGGVVIDRQEDEAVQADKTILICYSETDRCGDSQKTDNSQSVIQEFYKPRAKRKKLGPDGRTEPEILEMGFWALKVPWGWI